MISFIALYRGNSVVSAKLVAVSANPRLVSDVAAQLLTNGEPATDSVLAAKERGRRQALKLVIRHAQETDGL